MWNVFSTNPFGLVIPGKPNANLYHRVFSDYELECHCYKSIPCILFLLEISSDIYASYPFPILSLARIVLTVLKHYTEFSVIKTPCWLIAIGFLWLCSNLLSLILVTIAQFYTAYFIVLTCSFY